MAHMCANCGCLCHCRGDIDDVDDGETYSCDHCLDNRDAADWLDDSDLTD